jgi:hypothetical protein
MLNHAGAGQGRLQPGSAGNNRSMTRTRAALPLGFGLIVLGAWGALIPLVGPYFDFGFDTGHTWRLGEQHWTLSIAPGIAAAVGGMLIALHRRHLGALIAVLAGIWFALGPFLHPLWSDAVSPIATDDGKRAALWVAYFMAPAALIAYLAGLSQGLTGADDRAPAGPRPVSVP